MLRVIVRDVGVGPFSAENTAESLAPSHRYFGLNNERDSNTEREGVRSAVISLVKAGLLCEFLISVHLPGYTITNARRRRAHNTHEHLHMHTHVCVCAHT